MKKYIIGALGILISAIIIYYISRDISIEDIWSNIKQISIWQLLSLMLVYILSFLPRAIRWKLMFPESTRVTFKDSFIAIVAGFAGNNFIPARGGELIRMEVFSRRTKIARLTSLTSVFTEKILDGLVLLLFLLLSISLLNTDLLENIWLKNVLYLSLSIFLIATSAIIILKTNKRLVLKIFEKLLNNKLYVITEGIVEKVYNAIAFLQLNLNSLKIAFLSVLIWTIEGTVFVLAFYYFGLRIPVIVVGFFVLTIVNFGILIPSSPAYLGVFQGMVLLSLSLLNTKEELSLTLGVIIHFAQFFSVTSLAMILFTVSPLKSSVFLKSASKS
ncbi:lysylphosphatidylglycerol synthase transmembrane domain-containing protein [Chondrinema litorale]|uniref:lysylphosphatidylglycerol synthase transmembrane domain-containing protein n=1 Tax=Chondrinema litorale TaxID=2994555 RepID=UPI002543207D|nr:lysylphosphatidylglycerol synthase transmembrane domain-containing protein [Chondrinema litorale]UZR93208.1 lysylphosphatidylglycerol synthase transmembrane domain-containing protein [Chondrinema litorale]